jgi:hypothetical protein
MPQQVKDLVFEEELMRRASSPEMLQKILKVCKTKGAALPEVDTSEDSFPVISVHDVERLRQHVIEHLAFADPVRFEHRKRSIRVSSIGSRVKQYLNSNYKVQSGKMACQICHKNVAHFEVIEIFGDNELELEPMNLCVCRNCSPGYRKLRLDEDKMKKLKGKILAEDESVYYSMKPIEVRLGNMHLWFTPLHFAEIRMLLDVIG